MPTPPPPHRRGDPTPGATTGRPLHLAILLAFAGALTLYAVSAAPTVMSGDSAEIQAVALLGGVAHPTGYPTALLVGRVFGRLLPGDPAHRITMMSAVFGAVAVTLVLRLLVELGLSIRGAFAGAMLYGSTYTFWCSALRAEVYTLAISLALLALWRTVVALRSGRAGPSLAAGLLLGLTLTGHLAFALPVAALGLALAWRVARAARHPVPALAALAALAGAFLVGLTPYLYLVWADTRPHAMDFLRYIDLGFFPLGQRPAYFDSPWERVWWLITARNRLPPQPVVFAPQLVARGVIDSAIQFVLFEPGPVGVLLALVGVRRHLRTPGAAGGLFVVMCALSIGFASALSAGMMLGVFLMPATLLLALWAAHGAETLIEAARMRWPRAVAPARALACLIPVAVALPAQALRVHAREHPIGPLRVRLQEERDQESRGLVPSLRDYREPRRYGEAVLAALPESTLVIGRWQELMTLSYLRFAEGRRPDVSFQPLIYPNLLPRLARWQREHSSATHPFAVVSGVEEVRKHMNALDSLSVGERRWVWMQRQPLIGLEGRGSP